MLIYLICALFFVTMIVKCSKTDNPPIFKEIDQPISVSVTLDSVGATSTEVRVR